MLSWTGWAHQRLVYGRRIETLARAIADVLPSNTTVLDVGSGDGRLARRVMDLRRDVRITGVDVLVRPGSFIPIAAFDGDHLPYGDGEFDVVLLVDVVHHARHQMLLLRETARVARRAVVIKDHTVEGVLARPTLRMMDWVGNARHGVDLPYAYWTRDEWDRAFGELGLHATARRDRLDLYPWPASLAFDRGLHFLAVLEKTGA
jgi:SAM-dependent methyltransferase